MDLLFYGLDDIGLESIWLQMSGELAKLRQDSWW